MLAGGYEKHLGSHSYPSRETEKATDICVWLIFSRIDQWKSTTHRQEAAL